MDFDLELFLVIATAVTGIIWGAWVLFRRNSDKQKTEEKRDEPWYIEYSRSFFPVLILVLILRSFIAEPFRIPSGSMMPTLLIGDFILVNKFSYGVRLPVLHNKIFGSGLPERGDVAVFRYPGKDEPNYIKRVIGLPGDHIRWNDKQVIVNGVPLVHTAKGIYDGQARQNSPAPSQILSEQIGEVAHDILVMNHSGVVGEIVVEPGHYFVMGDNRDNSNDSRFWGLVPEENLVGKAMWIWMNWNLEFSRIGTRIE